MNRINLFVFLLVGHYLASGQSTAFQRQEKVDDFMAGLNLSATRYAGDLSERYNFSHLQIGWAAEAHTRWRFHEYGCLRADLGVYHLSGDQQYTRNKMNSLAFTTTNFTSGFDIEIDARSVDANMKNILYGIIGVGLTRLNPMMTVAGTSYDLVLFQTEGKLYKTWVGQFRYGVGMPFATGRNTQVRVEATYTHVLSDYLDDVSTVYVDKSGADAIERLLADRRLLTTREPNSVGAQRGNPYKQDGYFLITFQAIYKFH